MRSVITGEVMAVRGHDNTKQRNHFLFQDNRWQLLLSVWLFFHLLKRKQGLERKGESNGMCEFFPFPFIAIFHLEIALRLSLNKASSLLKPHMSSLTEDKVAKVEWSIF